jgi:hypothetical protein
MPAQPTYVLQCGAVAELCVEQGERHPGPRFIDSVPIACDAPLVNLYIKYQSSYAQEHTCTYQRWS